MLRGEPSIRLSLIQSAFIVLALAHAALGPIAAAAPLAGVQSSADLHGRVLDERGLPVPGASLRLEGTGFQTGADAQGRYRIAGLRPGAYLLVVEAAGYGPAVAALRVPREGESLRRDVVLRAGVVTMQEVLTVVERGRRSGLRWVLTRDEIVRAGSVARALARVPGVFVKEFGSGGAREISIRGGAPEQTLVLWGEERLLAPAGGAVDLAGLAPASIDSIEVVSRGSSSRYGAGAVAGVVRIHAAAPGARGASGHEVRAGVGSAGAREASARATLALPLAAVAVTGAAEGYERNFGRRVNSGGEAQDGSLGLRFAALGLSVSGAAHRSERGAPGPTANPTPHARITGERVLVSARHERSAAAWELKGEASVQSARSSFVDRDRRGPASDARETALALRLALARARAGGRIEAGLEARRHRISAASVAGSPGRGEIGLYLGGRWNPRPGGALSLSPNLRLDRITLEDDGIAGQAGSTRTFLSPGLAAALELGPALALHGYAGRSFRTPGFQDLFFVSGVGIRANPALRDERSRDLELGLDWRPSPAFSAAAAVFDRRLDGAIVWLPDFQFVWSPRNLARALVRGAELSTRWRPAEAWEVHAAYAFAPARFDFPGNRNPLPYRPPHLGRLEAVWGAGPVRSALEARLTGRRHPNLAGTNALEAYVLFDWSGGWRGEVAAGELVLELRVENLLDREYEVVFGFPGEGRSLNAALTYRVR